MCMILTLVVIKITTDFYACINMNNFIAIINLSISIPTEHFFSFLVYPNGTIPQAISRKNPYFCSLNEIHATPLLEIGFVKLILHEHYEVGTNNNIIEIQNYSHTINLTIYRNHIIHLLIKIKSLEFLNDVA